MTVPNQGAGNHEADLAVQDLSQRLGVAKPQVKVVSHEEVDWPDSSLGCPQPGMMYAQMITPGFKTTLEVNGKTYLYHGAGNRVIQCNK